MTRTRTFARSIGLAVLAAALASGPVAPGQQGRSPEAQDAAKGAGPEAAGRESVESINADHDREVARLERRRLERLARLAAQQSKAEADKTYEAYFRLAIAKSLYRDAEPVAERVIQGRQSSPQVTALAALVNVVAEADRGADQESLNSLAALVAARGQAGGGGAPAVVPLPASTRLSLVDAYYQRLVRDEQFDIARQAMQLIRDRAESRAVKDFAAGRLRRLEMIGKPAPPIDGTDLDGRPVRWAGYRGEVVLVVFWASWCLPNAQEVPWLERTYAAHGGRGFRILGINLDTAQEGGQDPRAVLPNVRRFVLDYNVRWPSLLNGPGPRDYAAAYGITEIPSSVLIGRDGTVIGLDLNPANLERAVAKAVGR